jgi:hypothetical protein
VLSIKKINLLFRTEKLDYWSGEYFENTMQVEIQSGIKRQELVVL